jgi:hypothetical protein
MRPQLGRTKRFSFSCCLSSSGCSSLLPLPLAIAQPQSQRPPAAPRDAGYRPNGLSRGRLESRMSPPTLVCSCACTTKGEVDLCPVNPGGGWPTSLLDVSNADSTVVRRHAPSRSGIQLTRVTAMPGEPDGPRRGQACCGDRGPKRLTLPHYVDDCHSLNRDPWKMSACAASIVFMRMHRFQRHPICSFNERCREQTLLCPTPLGLCCAGHRESGYNHQLTRRLRRYSAGA